MATALDGTSSRDTPVEAMEDDELTVFDVERCLLRGSIVERQRDRRPDAPAGDPDRISHRG
jgi:hypothetical protein